MKILIFGKGKDSELLFKKVSDSIEELGLSDFIKLEITKDSDLEKKLDIKKEPALIIEEESIDFIDMIFEGIIPDEQEIKSMIISIIGGNENNHSCSGSNCGIDCSC